MHSHLHVCAFSFLDYNYLYYYYEAGVDIIDLHLITCITKNSLRWLHQYCTE